jgi:hypothetical protein
MILKMIISNSCTGRGDSNSTQGLVVPDADV